MLSNTLILIAASFVALATCSVPLDLKGGKMRTMQGDMTNPFYFWGFGKTDYFLDINRNWCRWESEPHGGSQVGLINDALIPLFNDKVHNLAITMRTPCDSVHAEQGVYWDGKYWSTSDGQFGWYDINGFYPLNPGEYIYVAGSIKDLANPTDITLYCMLQDPKTHVLSAGSFTYKDIEGGDYGTAIKKCFNDSINPIRFCLEKDYCKSNLQVLDDSQTITGNSTSAMAKVLEAMTAASLKEKSASS